MERIQLMKQLFRRGSLLSACLFFFSAAPMMAQAPDINEYVFVDVEPKPLNLDSVRSLIGYPEEAITQDLEGTVVARILVDTTGKYVRHEIVRIVHPSLAIAVTEYLSMIRFEPARHQGKARMFWINLPFAFQLVKREEMIQERIDLLTEQLTASPEDHELWHKRGIQYTELGDYKTAVVDFGESIRLNPRLNKRKASKNTYAYMFYAYYGRGVAHSGLEKPAEAEEDFTQALAAASEMALPDSGVSATIGSAYQERAYQRLLQEKYAPAIEDLRQALALADSAEACNIWNLMSEAGLASENSPVLVEAYTGLIECQPSSKEIYLYSRGYHHRKAGNFLSAIADFQQVIALSKNEALKIAAMNYLALSQLDADQPKEAETTVGQVLSINALNPLSYFVRAQLAQKLKGPEAGCDDLRRGLLYGLAGEEADIAKRQLLDLCGITWEE